jgi:membrane-associated PAP2 superfamily phosphatase
MTALPTAPHDRAWLLRQTLLLAACAGLLLVVFEHTALDLRLQALFYDPTLRDFPLRTNWLLSNVLHHGLKLTAYAVAILAIGLCIAGIRGRLPWLPPRQAWLAAAGLLLIPLCVSLIKQVSYRHCPWDIIEFGGYAPYVGLLDSAPGDITRGACFPAGHSSAGFSWMIWAVALRATRPQWAHRALIAGLAIGGLMGFSRMLQGAHFLSHTLWTAWFAWGFCIAAAAALRVELSPRAAVLESA